MKGAKPLWLATTLVAVALAGCTDDGGSGGLDMFVTAGDDPNVDAYTFKATGASADQFLWDLGDGTILEGKEVEHVFGFTNGDITVKLTACTAGECESILRSVPLGGDKNVPPAGSFVATTEWAVVGETVAFDATGSTDPNGDPILFRWNCERVDDIQPPADGGGHAHGPPGVPFGVNALATYDPLLTGGDDHGADLCADFAIDADQPWSRDTGAITGSFTEPGIYQVDVFVRDPKSAAWIGRLNIAVSETRPDAQISIPFSGTLQIGSQGSFQDNCEAAAQGEECPLGTLDREEHTFTVPVPNLLATVTFQSTTLGDQDGGASWSIKVGEGTVSPVTTETSKFLGPLALINGREYTIVVEAGGPSAQVEYSGEILVDSDLNPRHLYQMPV